MPLPFGTYPAPDPRPWVPMLRIFPESKQSYLVLSERIIAHDIHWLDVRNKPCTRHMGECILCGPKFPPRWAGFLAVLATLTRTKHLLHITPAAMENCPALKERDGHLRGLLVRPTRKGKSTKSGLIIELMNAPPGYSDLPLLPSVNVNAALARWWDCDIAILEPTQGGDAQLCL